MWVDQHIWTESEGWTGLNGSGGSDNASFVLYFGAPGTLDSGDCIAELRAHYPGAHLVGCTTGGEILADDVHDGTIVASAVRFDKTRVELASANVGEGGDSHAAGEALGRELAGDGLRAIFVLSDGIHVNGSDLVRGITGVVGEDVSLTGGLAGDGADFGKTLVGADDDPREGNIAALGFYGPSLRVGHGSVGGWDVFGPERVITRSEGNVLFELDGKPALDLYKSYLGDEAENLPGSGLLFPLKIRPEKDSIHEVVRTIVGIDEAAQSMIFAGDVPEGYAAQLMRGNFENLIEGAAEAARMAGTGSGQSLAVLISCIGRKLLLGQRIGEEVEAVGEALGDAVPRIGFYSYGEISPHAASGLCELHNQTMTITVLSED